MDENKKVDGAGGCCQSAPSCKCNCNTTISQNQKIINEVRLVVSMLNKYLELVEGEQARMRISDLSKAIKNSTPERMVWGIDEAGNEFILTSYWFLKITGRFPDDVVKGLLPYFASRPMANGAQVQPFPCDSDSVLTNAAKIIEQHISAKNLNPVERTGLSQNRYEIIYSAHKGYLYYNEVFTALIPDNARLEIDSDAKAPMLLGHFSAHTRDDKCFYTFGVLPFDVKEPNQYLKEEF